jgi:hypothetical protein
MEKMELFLEMIEILSMGPSFIYLEKDKVRVLKQN